MLAEYYVSLVKFVEDYGPGSRDRVQPERHRSVLIAVSPRKGNLSVIEQLLQRLDLRLSYCSRLAEGARPST